MPSWKELAEQLDTCKSNEEITAFFRRELPASIAKLKEVRDHNVIVYATAWIEKPEVPQKTMVSNEDINGMMTSLHKMDFSKGLTLVLHTPGGSPTAAESIVEYLYSKFKYVEVIVPTFAMSAGTMIALGCDSILMGAHSQLGPIDPQMAVAPGRQVSAHALKSTFETAKSDILADPRAARVWAPVIGNIGAGLLEEADRALDYGKSTVTRWLSERMMKGKSENEIAELVERFAGDGNLSHGKRISAKLAKDWGVNVSFLEEDDDAQEAALTAHHLYTTYFERSRTAKIVMSSNGALWARNVPSPSVKTGK